MLEVLKVIILGIVEGLTEFLPVSSTGHLILVNEFVKLQPEHFANAFNVIIQLGAILAVVVIYFERLNPFPKAKLDHGKYPKQLEEKGTKHRWIKKFYYWLTHNKTVTLWLKIIIAIIPSGIIGVLFDDKIDEKLMNPITVSIALVFYGVVIILMENKNKNRTDYKYESASQIPFSTALGIGFFQCLALVPGTSRSASTIIGAMILGLNRTAAADFSFFLAIPTMVGATLVKIVKAKGLTLNQWGLILLGFIVSYIVAYFVIKKFLGYIKNNDFKVFGYYRVILGLLVLLYFSLFK